MINKNRIAEAQRRLDEQANMTPQQIIEAAAKRHKFLYSYDPANPTNYDPSKVSKEVTLREIKGRDVTTFNHDVLKQMREGKLKSSHPLFEILHNVKSILLTEAYDTFSEFMAKLRTDTESVKNPNNVIRRVYNDFMNGKPQRWKLIDPDEYVRCMRKFTHEYTNPLGGFRPLEPGENRPQFGAEEDYWTPRIYDWIANIKDNIAQITANSYLTSGPSLSKQKCGRIQYDPRVANSKGELTLNRLWYDLSGDEKIPLTDKEYDGERMKYFNRKYWIPFVEYIETNFGSSPDGSEAFETDSPLDGAFDLIAEFDKNYSNPKRLFGVLDRLKNLGHGRGSFAHIIFKGGKEAYTKITKS